jgi:arylsulfatase A-like enzyme
MLDEVRDLNQQKLAVTGDPEIATRIAQYEMAFRMQASVPELTEIKDEPQHVLDMYGPEVTKPGKYAANCLLARRLAERGVRFIQLFHMGWDHHGNLPNALRGQCRDTDQPTAALIKDLKARDLLKDTLIVWGGEFGRTVYSQGALTATNYGRDHHPRCFSIFLAGAGIRAGMSLGETDDYCYNIVKDGVHVRDLHATILHLLGINHEKFTYKFNGLDAKLTGVEPSRIVSEILA